MDSTNVRFSNLQLKRDSLKLSLVRVETCSKVGTQDHGNQFNHHLINHIHLTRNRLKWNLLALNRLTPVINVSKVPTKK